MQPLEPQMNQLARFFDYLHHFWDNASTERSFGLLLLWIYLAALLSVELKRMGWYPEWLPQPPDSHYYSIQLAFTLILGLEVISLIFTLPASLSRSIGKQLEILTLILLRNAFKELSVLPEPVSIDMENLGQVINIAVSATGALCVFVCLGYYRRLSRSRPFKRGKELLANYVYGKKLLALALLLIFTGLGVRDIYLFIQHVDADFFETIYTILIFADIAMVLIAQRYMPCYYAVFRNSGFVIGTLMMRLSLAAPPLVSASIAVFSALYVLALTWCANNFIPADAER